VAEWTTNLNFKKSLNLLRLQFLLYNAVSRMDFHFFTHKEDGFKPDPVVADTKQVIKIAKNLLPVLFLAIFLPVFYGLVANPPQLKFLSHAGQNLELRIWLEPANVLTVKGHEVELTAFALFDNDSTNIPALKIKLSPDSSLSLDKAEISTFTSFSGKVSLGKIKVTPSASGEYKVTIPESGVVITGIEGPVKIVTAPASLTVR
jgi:hypothetical protein